MAADSQSRTHKSLRNSSVALIFYFVGLALEFFSRRIFLQYLGEEVLGLNTTATSLLQFLNLAEMGIGAAIAFALYKPLFDKDRTAIVEIISLQGHFYKKVATFVIAGAAVLMCFFPWIFDKMQLPLWYAYASFGVLLLSALLGYYFNYKQVLLSADQQNYRIQLSYKLPMLIKVLCQMLAVWLLADGFIWWVIIEGVFAVVATVTLSATVRRTYPYLTSVRVTRSLRKKYRVIYTKIKQLMYNQVAGFALAQTSPLIIYAYIDLSLVAVYGNYLMLSNGIQALLRAVFNDMAGGIGNLVASSDIDHILNVFRELFSVRFAISAILTFAALVLTQPLIVLWVGPQYLLPTSTLWLIVAMLFIQLTRTIVQSFIGAYGAYGDIWAPVIEAVLNIGLSIWLGYYWGLNGILSGVLISMFLCVVCWKPVYLYLRGFKVSIRHYIGIFLKNMTVSVLTGAVIYFAFSQFVIPADTSAMDRLLYGIAQVIAYTLALVVAMYVTRCGIEDFFIRMYAMFLNRRRGQ